MPDTPKYREQFERVKRFYQRIKEIDEGRTHDRPSDFYYDVILMLWILAILRSPYVGWHSIKQYLEKDSVLDALWMI